VTRQQLDRTSVVYCDQVQRRQYEVTIVSGRLYWANRSLDSDYYYESDLVDCSDMLMYLMAPDRKLYMHTKTVGKMQHSSFLAGAAVVFAGSCRVHHGWITVLTNESGHYKPSNDALYKFIEFLRSCGLDTASMSVLERGRNAASRVVQFQGTATVQRPVVPKRPKPKKPKKTSSP